MSEPLELTNSQFAAAGRRVRALGGKWSIAVGEDGIAFDVGRGYTPFEVGGRPAQLRDGASLMVILPKPEKAPEAAVETDSAESEPSKPRTRGRRSP